MRTRFFDPPCPRLFGHRGSNRFPENTLPAFRDAVDAGLKYLELDVQSTRDRKIVVHHDTNVQRICGRDIKINDLDLTDIKKLDAGYTFAPESADFFPVRGYGIEIPTLAEVLIELPEIFFTIEIKPDSAETTKLTLAAIREIGAEDRVILASANNTPLASVRRLAPELPTSFSFTEVADFYNRLRDGDFSDYRPPGQALQIPPCYEGRDLIVPEAIKAAHRMGLEIHVWTVNDPKEMQQLLARGVNGIMSDDTRLLQKTVDGA